MSINSIKERLFESQGVSWWIILLEGIAAVVIGILVILAPDKTVSALLRLLGFFFITKGILGIIGIIRDRNNWVYILLLSIVAIIIGLIIFLAPMATFSIIRGTLLLFVGLGVVTLGFIEIVRAIFKGGGCGIAVLGILTILLGLIVLGHPMVPPGTYANLLGGIAIIGGIATMVVSFTMRS